MNLYKEEMSRHIEELRNRIKACTRDELEIICDTIAENNSDIILGSVYKKIRSCEDIVEKLKGDINE